jgi:hypothetical protein
MSMGGSRALAAGISIIDAAIVSAKRIVIAVAVLFLVIFYSPFIIVPVYGTGLPICGLSLRNVAKHLADNILSSFTRPTLRKLS